VPTAPSIFFCVSPKSATCRECVCERVRERVCV
jgi:hypothetical protein